MDSYYLDTINDLGPPQRCIPLSSEQDTRLSSHLPQSFMDFLRRYGFGDYFNRKLQYCDPADYVSVLALIFAADPEFSHKDCHILAYTAFGELHCWSERHDFITINLVDLRLTSAKLAPANFLVPSHLPKRERSTDPDVLSRSLIPYEKRQYEEFDANDQPLFERCVKVHGPLERGEVYGYFPAMAMVGNDSPMRRVENIRRVRALEHFAILAQMGTFHLMRLEQGQYTSVRPIG